MIGIGCDIEENKRFKNKTLESDDIFLKRIFTQNELDYCFSKAHAEQHLCVRFCAKEAIIKALYSINIKDVYYDQIDIINDNDGCPFVKLKKYKDINVQISLSHCKDYSIANALVITGKL